MSLMARVKPMRRSTDAIEPFKGPARSRAAVFEASFEAILRAQDAPRACSAINCVLAMTRLARPNRLNSCAAFLA